MATTEKGLYHPFAHARGVTVGSFRITANTPPTVQDDPGGIIASVARTGVGVYVITLKRRYARVHALANTNSVAGFATNVSATVPGGTVANTITLQIVNAAGAANDAAGSINTVAFYGYSS